MNTNTKNHQPLRAADIYPRNEREELVEIKQAAELLSTHHELIETFLELDCIEGWYEKEDDVPYVFLSELVECFEDWAEIVREYFERYKAKADEEGGI